MELPRVPTHWAVAPRPVGVHDAVVGGHASSGTFEPVVTRRGDLEIALLFPVAEHRNSRHTDCRERGDGGEPIGISRGRAAARARGCRARGGDRARAWDAESSFPTLRCKPRSTRLARRCCCIHGRADACGSHTVWFRTGRRVCVRSGATQCVRDALARGDTSLKSSRRVCVRDGDDDPGAGV